MAIWDFGFLFTDSTLISIGYFIYAVAISVILLTVVACSIEGKNIIGRAKCSYQDSSFNRAIKNNIVIKWIKAIHEGICPPIKFH